MQQLLQFAVFVGIIDARKRALFNGRPQTDYLKTKIVIGFRPVTVYFLSSHTSTVSKAKKTVASAMASAPVSEGKTTAKQRLPGYSKKCLRV